MKSLLKLQLITFLLLMISVGCENQLEMPNTQIGVFKPSIQQFDFSELSNQLGSSDSTAGSYIADMSNFINFPSLLMTMPESYESMSNNNARFSNDSTYYTWSNGGFDIIYTYYQSGSGYYFEYQAFMNEILYYNISGWQSTDGTAGNWSYDINTSAISGILENNYSMELSWSTSGSNSFAYEMSYDNGINNVYFEMYSTNLAVTYNYYINSVLSYSAFWNSAGGSFSTYNATGDVVTYTSW